MKENGYGVGKGSSTYTSLPEREVASLKKPRGTLELIRDAEKRGGDEGHRAGKAWYDFKKAMEGA
jgi:hypothetical protein